MGKVYIVKGKTACMTPVYALILKNQKFTYEYIYHYINCNRYNINKKAKFSANLGHIN